MTYALPIVLAYLLGSVPFGYLLVRIFLKQDVRTQGSGNIGATNVARSGAKGLGLATLLLDAAKGLAAVELGLHLPGGGYDLACWAALAAVVGHVFPLWLGFKGGKGVATALGVFLGIAPRAAACVLLVFLGMFLLTRFVSLASIVASGTFPLFGFHFTRDRAPGVVCAFVLIPVLIIVKHYGNIRRLLSGTENRFGAGHRGPGSPTKEKAEA